MRYVGIDIGKKACSVTLVNEEGKSVGQLEIENAKPGWTKLGRRLKPGDRLVLEAGTYAYPIHDHFVAKGFEVVPAHPRGIRQITESDKKTDRRDSEVLAQLLRVNYLPRAYIPDPETLVDRDLLRTRVDLASSQTSLKNRVRAYLARSSVELPFKESELFDKGLGWLRQHRWGDSRDVVMQSLLIEYDAIQAQKAVLDAEIALTASDDESAKLLMSIPGIDYCLAMAIVAEVGDVTRFASREAFRAYAGCAPRSRESAGVNRASGTNRDASPRLKTTFSMVEQTAMRVNGPIKDAYQKRLDQTGQEARAHAVGRRKVCDLVYVILTKREPCNWASPASHERKLTNLANRIRKAEAPRELPTPP